MSDETPKYSSPEQIELLPETVRDWMRARTEGPAVGVTVGASLEDVFRGNEWSGVRQQLMASGMAMHRNNDGQEQWLAADITPDGQVLAVAAAIPRQTGKATDFMGQIADFQLDTTSTSNQGRQDKISLFHRIYLNDGITNTAINKMAALVAPEGSYKVTFVKGQRGKSGDKQAAEGERALNWWKDNVNARSETSVITGDRGITTFVRRGARLAMIEGYHIARHLWLKKAVDIPNLKPFELPMNLQTFSAANIEIVDGLEGTDYEILYWKPPASFLQLLQDPKDKNLAAILKKLIPADVRSALLKDRKVFLDPALCFHVKNRGLGITSFGSSSIEPTLNALRYSRALDALELTVITNLMARMVILSVGSDNEKSVYHKAEVSGARLGLLQRIMRNVGPTATILWAGPDLKATEVSAHEALPDTVDRMKLAERRQLMAWGVPVALMMGEGNDGKAVAAAAAVAVASQLQELQDQYTQALKSLGERILLENGYEQVEVTWEWHDNMLADKQAAQDMVLKIFTAGLMDTQTATEELGFDYAAMVTRMNADVSAGFREKAFGPPLSAPTTNPTGTGGETGGRPPSSETTKTDPTRNKEKKQGGAPAKKQK